MTATELFPQFDCRHCSDRQKVERGCEQDAPFPYWTDIQGNERRRCPRRPMLERTQWWNTIISAYNHYQSGFLPHGGGIADQTALFSTLMTKIEDTINRCREAKDRQNQSQGSSKPKPKKGQSLLGKN